MKYTRLFNNHEEYVAYTASTMFIRPNVSYCILEDEPHCTPSDYCQEGHTYELVGNPSYPARVPASATSFTLSFEYNDIYTTIACQETVTFGSESVSIAIDENPTTSDRTITGYYEFNGIAIPYILTQEAKEIPSYDKQYLTFEILTDGVILWKANGTLTKTISYSKDDGLTWTSITSSSSGTPINVTSGEKILFKGNNTQYATNKDNYSAFDASGGTSTYNIYGNIMSLIGGDDFSGLTSFSGKGYVFKSLFDGSNVISAENLVLPVMELTDNCYRAMFANTPSMIKAPKLEATSLATNCYWFMFQRTSITEAPVLSASTLVNGCYCGMFHECPNLNYIECLATDISPLSATTMWTYHVASSGTFLKAPNMEDWSVGADGIPIGWTVYSAGLADPTISCDGKKVYIACDTLGAEIYYRINQSGTYSLYGGPIPITADTIVEAYSTLDGDVSDIVEESCIYIPSHDYSDDYLTFNILSDGNILWKSLGSGMTRTISYSKDDGLTWTDITSSSAGTPILVTANEKVIFKGTNTTYAKDKTNYSGFDASGATDAATYDVEGNVMSLIYGDNFEGKTTFSGGTYNFCSLFKASKTISAENLVLPATTLTKYCYRAMFSWATDLVKGPELPAMTLSQGCYWYMFECTAIERAPELNAPVLVNECYGNMFTGCTNLNYIKCMAKSGFSSTNCKQNWVKNVAPSGTFVKDSSVSTSTWSVGTNGIPTGWVVYDEEALFPPTIEYDGFSVISLSCETPSAKIYYKLDNAVDYEEYVSAITINEDTFIEAYSMLGTEMSMNVSKNCVYISDDPFESSNRNLDDWTYNNQAVKVPYSVNADDGHSSSYAKGTFNFETSFGLREAQPTYLWFQHADQSASIYIDNVLVEKHWGGYNAFFCDISQHVHSGTNVVKVALKNNEGNNLAPADGDFNFNATLGYVKLFTSKVLPSTEYGYDGFHITSTVSSASATINVKTKIPTGATVVCVIKDGNTNVYSASSASTVEEMVFTTTIQNPHLWSGTIDPHLYNVILEVYKDGDLYHRYERPYGLRYYNYVINDTTILSNNEPYTGFLLNGSPYPLRGVCMHNDIVGKANALTRSDIAEDFEIIQELGCNFIRLAHYPHPKEVYDWCDMLGIIVQTEVPCVNKLQSTMPSDYYSHLEGQYEDMVNQHYNHPSIMFWGLSNETKRDDVDFGKTKIEGYTSLIKNLDQERWVGYVVDASASNPSSYYNNPNVDWFGCNIYVGWYTNTNSNNPTSQLNTRIANTITALGKPVAYSEYGAGGTQRCHSDDFMTTTTRGNNPRHDIEYQMWLHEGQIAAIRNFPQLLFTAQWQLFDIAVSKRQEGYTICLDGENTSTDDSLKFLNDKGLVERDHHTKKDTFYLYKAEWSSDNFVHICGKDYTKMSDRVIKCYSNDGASLSLYVNNSFVESVNVTDNIASFTASNYNVGDVIRVDGEYTSDTFTF